MSRLLASVILLAAGSALAQQPAPGVTPPSPLRPSPAMDPYAGVVVDSTVTFIGREFYNSFVAVWRDLERVDRFSLEVVERPSARWGSLVWIEYRNRRMFNAFLSPGRRDYVRLAAQGAARDIYQAVIQADLQRLLFRDADLAPEEF